MLSKLMVVSLLTLASCAPHPLNVPVIQKVYCLTPEQFQKLVEAEPEKVGNSLDKDLRVAHKQLIGQNILVRQYSDGLLQVLAGCTGQTRPLSLQGVPVVPAHYHTSTSETQPQRERTASLRDT
jgi:hypothetical protein